MSQRTVTVVHRSTMIAEGLAAGLGRFPEVIPVGTATTMAEGERFADRTDVFVLDEYVAGASQGALRLRRRGIRVVMLGEGSGEEDEEVRVSPRASLASLAAAVVPQLARRRRSPVLLTQREREVLALVGRGLPGKRVARHLGISAKTVEHHKTRIFSKLGVANQAAAVRLVTEHEMGRENGWTLSNT